MAVSKTTCNTAELLQAVNSCCSPPDVSPSTSKTAQGVRGGGAEQGREGRNEEEMRQGRMRPGKALPISYLPSRP